MSRNQWPSLGLPDEELEAHAKWLERDDPRFQKTMVMFFRLAGILLRQTRVEFTLLPLVYVQCVIGLESVLRLLYQDAGKRSLLELLQQAESDGHFSEVEVPQLNRFTAHDIPSMKKWLVKQGFPTEIRWIAVLRNALLHGEYHLNPDMVDLILYVRCLVDALIPHLPPSRYAMGIETKGE